MRGLLFGIATIATGMALILYGVSGSSRNSFDFTGFGLFVAIVGFVIAAVATLTSIYKKDNNKK